MAGAAESGGAWGRDVDWVIVALVIVLVLLFCWAVYDPDMAPYFALVLFLFWIYYKCVRPK
jgi:hypothetical protein